MFHNVLMTSLTPLQNTHEVSYGWPNQPFTGIWPEDIVKEEPKVRVTQKKSKRHRTAFTTDQILELEYYYRKHKYVNAMERDRLAKSMNLTDRAVKVWFQNRRMKEKKIAEESSNESSSSECTSSEVSPKPFSPTPSTEGAIQPAPFVPTWPNANANMNAQYEMPTYGQPPPYPYQPLAIDIPNQMPELGVEAYECLPNNEPFVNDLNVYPTSYYPDPEYYHYSRPLYDDCVSSTNEIDWSVNPLDYVYGAQ